MALLVVSDKYLVINDVSNDWPLLRVYDLLSDQQLDSIQWLTNATNDQIRGKNSSSSVRIICAAFSSDSRLFAALDNNKLLLIFSINHNTNEFSISNTHKVERNCIKIIFSKNGEQVIGGDKSGNVYSYSVIKSEDNGNDSQLLLGHCSMLLDLCFSPNGRYLLSCDRDEKIRVTHYPNTYNIQTYCLGHSEFVSTIACINTDVVISGSGDESIRLWNASTGQQINELHCNPNNQNNSQNKFAVKKLTLNRIIDCQFICVCFYGQSIIYIYQINSNYELKLIHTLGFDSSAKEVIDIQFDVLSNNLLWVLLSDSDKPLHIYEITLEHAIKSDRYSKIIADINSNKYFTNICVDIDDNYIKGLYKHWYNNVDIYIKKKHERQESNRKKKKYIKI